MAGAVSHLETGELLAYDGKAGAQPETNTRR
jgi:hypothetical protein